MDWYDRALQETDYVIRNMEQVLQNAADRRAREAREAAEAARRAQKNK